MHSYANTSCQSQFPNAKTKIKYSLLVQTLVNKLAYPCLYVTIFSAKMLLKNLSSKHKMRQEASCNSSPTLLEEADLLGKIMAGDETWSF
jgi:hypothetical protein